MLRFNRMESILFSWKPIWSGMILLLIKDDCKCSRWQGFIWTLIAVIFIPWTPYVHNFLDFYFLLNLRQIGIFSRIVARNAFVLHSWMMTSVFGFPKSAYISFSRIWLWTISDAHAFLDFNWFLLFQVFKTHKQHYSSNTANAYIPIALIELFPQPFSTSGAHWIIFSGTSALYW